MSSTRTESKTIASEEGFGQVGCSIVERLRYGFYAEFTVV